MDGGLLLALGLVAIFAALTTLVAVLATAGSERRQVSRSMSVLRSTTTSSAAPSEASFGDRVLVPGLGRLSSAARRFSPAGVNDKVGRRLDLAGNPPRWDVERVLAFKSLGLLVLGGVAALVGLSDGFGRFVVYGVVGAAVGFFLPDVLLYNAGTKRQAAMQRALPDALDLLTISVEAGLGFDAALAQVARNTPGPLAAEFFRVLKEMQIGTGRADSLRALADRSDLPELRGFIAAMVQADGFGIPIAAVLRAQAGEMRLKRQQRAEEQAQKVPIKVLFPLVFTILPSLFVVIIGPGALAIIQTFSDV